MIISANIYLRKCVVDNGCAVDEICPAGRMERVDGVGAAALESEVDKGGGVAEVVGHVGPVDGSHGTWTYIRSIRTMLGRIRHNFNLESSIGSIHISCLFWFFTSWCHHLLPMLRQPSPLLRQY